MIKLISPTEIELIDYEAKEEALRSFLTYKDTSAVFLTQRFKKNRYALLKMGEEAWTEHLNELRSQEQVCLLKERDGRFYTYAGLAHQLANKFQDKIVNNLVYPEPQPTVWYNKPNFDLRYYQKLSVDNLLEAKHGAISLPTGAGKSRVILQLFKELGLKTLVMAPTVNIATQLYQELKYYLGERYVGMIGAGKKKLGKLLTVAIGASLARMKPNTPEWTSLEDIQVFISDESHVNGADTLSKVCLNLAKNAPYRFFVSATQTRNDGSELLLDGIIGPLVLEKKLSELVSEDFLAKPNFCIVKVNSSSNYASDDALKMMSKHLYHNKALHSKFAELANYFAANGKKVMIAIDHLEQFEYLVNQFKYEMKFAHGGTNKDNRDGIPEKYHKSDTSKIVADFNEGKFPILVGTGCIGMGTDIRPVDAIFNLQGGKSEIKFSQLVGRGTRKVPGKHEFFFFDHDLENVPMLHNHLKERVKIYRSLYDNVKYL
jgi:superfamily II DNA or RNA helicase